MKEEIKGSELSRFLVLSAHFPWSAHLLEGNTRRQNKMLLCVSNAFPSTTDTKKLQKHRRCELRSWCPKGSNKSVFKLNFYTRVIFRNKGLQNDAGATPSMNVGQQRHWRAGKSLSATPLIFPPPSRMQFCQTRCPAQPGGRVDLAHATANPQSTF